jgi:HEAT repeat protein
LKLADEWLAQRPEQGVFTWIVICYALTSYGDTYDRFSSLFARTDLTDANLDVLVDNFASWATFRDADPRYKEALAIIASYLEHSSPQVRWTAAFSLGSLRGSEYRRQLVQLQADRTLTPYGHVSGVARNAVRAIDGEHDVDLHDASSP